MERYVPYQFKIFPSMEKAAFRCPRHCEQLKIGQLQKMRLQLCLIRELGKEVLVETKTVLVRTPPLVESILCLKKKAEHHLNTTQHSRVHCSEEHRRHVKPVPQRMIVHVGHTCTASGIDSRASLKQGTPTPLPS
ncbi:hypothetical protein GOP47_0000101 [Adiantum capillus-veneris]|uniref:Uncharacterized protein n=1 Tax=Adiantum capillus-veneris TaxID=13818 RepID=A0A9D4ZSJ3_ADICA|nr:hypothetical protein GOP47_0000101 [Adiantum capillus-veneris]